jgi:hypothetical protein
MTVSKLLTTETQRHGETKREIQNRFFFAQPIPSLGGVFPWAPTPLPPVY